MDRVAVTPASSCRHVVGCAIQSQTAHDAGADEDVRAYYRSLDSRRFPATTCAAALPTTPGEEFRFGLGLILDGLAAQGFAQ